MGIVRGAVRLYDRVLVCLARDRDISALGLYAFPRGKLCLSGFLTTRSIETSGRFQKRRSRQSDGRSGTLPEKAQLQESPASASTNRRSILSKRTRLSRSPRFLNAACAARAVENGIVLLMTRAIRHSGADLCYSFRLYRACLNSPRGTIVFASAVTPTRPLWRMRQNQGACTSSTSAHATGRGEVLPIACCIASGGFR